MDIWQHLKMSGEIELQGLTETLASRFSQLIARGHSVAALLSHFSDEFGHLPVDTLRNLAQASRNWQVWNIRKRQLEAARKDVGLPALPVEVFHQAVTPDQLDAIVRTARLCPKTDVEDEAEWPEILAAGVDLWSRGMKLAKKEGVVRCNAKDLEHPANSEYGQYIKRQEDLDNIAPHTWLAMRRGVKEGVLELSIDLPSEDLLQEVKNFQPQLGPPAAGRKPESLLDELILDDLVPWLKRILDAEAQIQVTKRATEALSGLLHTSGVQSKRLGAVYLSKPKAPVAAILADREGEPLAHKVLKAEGNWPDRVLDFFREHETQHVVLPFSALDPGLLSQLETKLAAEKIQLLKIRPAALSEARRPFTDPPLRMGSSTASALVLARRALDPLKEWSRVDPVSIGIAEYQNDLDPDLLRAALVETVELCKLERRKGKRVHMGASASKGNVAMAQLNPMVKSLNDLRPGMTVHGMITNISHFGAFVNIGLPQEALVHISELSDSFVSNPNEVVRIGQKVTAHVLSVEPARGRISLSLKSNPKISYDRDDRGGGLRSASARPGGPGREGNGAPPMSKAEALANLEKLFKK